MEYISTERYTAEVVNEMGVDRVRVMNSMGMVVGFLSPEEFEQKFAPIPEPDPEPQE